MIHVSIDEFQINEINVDLRTSGFDNEVLCVIIIIIIIGGFFYLPLAAKNSWIIKQIYTDKITKIPLRFKKKL